MTRDVKAELASMAGSFEILSAASFRFAGEPPIHLGAPAAAPSANPPAPNEALAAGLQAVLYQRCYCHRLNEPAPVADAAPDPQLPTRLSWANRARERWDAGWQIYQLGANGEIWIL